MDVDTSPMDLALRVVAGQFNGPVLDVLQRGFAVFLDAGGAVPLERCLRLPRSTIGFRRTQRDRWLIELARSTEGKTARAKCVAISTELNTFLARGSWHAWRDMQDPPAGTSRLRVVLFYAAKFNDGKGLSAKQVGRIVGHLFR
ncbi:MAG: hypothetical protein Q8R06_09665 [Polaromonas sp.]|uniref:hypothetical protein n=1 Tax=Polaromonas sp. TaxID=1869339 RepID=UPI0027326BF6|nr:hypothetical protein [Polaromonas sp.]MDP3797402.1 hypothetical protein [Polaromonas sp.]